MILKSVSSSPQHVVEAERAFARGPALLDEEAFALRQQHILETGQRRRCLHARDFGLAEIQREVGFEPACVAHAALCEAVRSRPWVRVLTELTKNCAWPTPSPARIAAQRGVVVGVKSARQHDAVFDVDAIEVDRRGNVGCRGEGEAE